jgi:hypothetical protein
MIVAKFRCTQVSKNEDGSEEVKLIAAHGPENESWSKYTPYGDLTMGISNPDAQGRFEPGKEYMLRFEPAPDGS